MYKQNIILTRLGFATFICMLFGLFFSLPLYVPSVQAAPVDPTINYIIVNGTTISSSNLSPISYSSLPNMSHRFEAELSSDRLPGVSYDLAISFSPDAGTVTIPVLNDTIDLGTRNLNEQTTYTVTYTLSKQEGVNPKTTVQELSFSLYTGVLDNTSPRVESSNPVSGNNSWAINDNLLIYFSEEIDSNTITNGTIILRDSNNTPIACQNFDPQVSGGKTILSIDPIDSLKYSTSYTLGINGLKDLAGNSLAPYSLSFSTMANADPPRIIASNPVNNAANVPLRGPITLTFNKSLNTSTINDQTIFLTDNNGARPNLSFSASNNNGATVVTITPQADLAYLTTYTINIINSGGNAIKDLYDQTVAASAQIFTTIPAGPPSIISQVPTPTNSNVSVNSTIAITFSQDMDELTLNSSNIYLRKEGTTTNISALYTYNPSNRTLSLSPFSRLESGVRYYIYITASVKGTNSLSMSPVNWYFSTSSSVNNTTIVEYDPTINASGVAMDKVIRFRFSTSMNSASINTSSVYMSQAGTIIPSRVSYDPYYNWVSITPNSYLSNNCEYQVHVTDSVKDSYGNNIIASSWKFYTGYSYSAGISERDPSANATDVDLDSVIRFRFDQDMNSSTINSSNIYLTIGSSRVSCRVSYDSYTRWVTITPYDDLQTDTRYTVNISSSVQDYTGHNITATSWRFNTIDDEYYDRAVVIDRDPYSNANGVAVDKQIKFRFNKDMRSSTIKSSNIYLTKSGTTVSSQVSYNSNTRWVTIIPDNLLQPNTEYTVNLSNDVRDSNGNYITSSSWRFTTASTNSFKIISQQPVPYSTTVGLTPTIRIGFNNTPDVSTLNANNLSLRSAGSIIPCNINYDYSLLQVTISPLQTLSPGTDYTVSVGTGVKDIYGNYLTASSWTFRTEAQLAPMGKPGQPLIMLNGKYVTFTDAQPYIKNSRTLLPYRTLLELLGAEISWDQKLQRVTARLNGNTIDLFIGQKKAWRNNQVILLDVAPEIKNNRTMVPLRFVTESLGFKTDWQASTYTITLTR